jgi:hypothetical protein
VIPFLIGALAAGEGGAGSYSLSPPTNFNVTDQSDCNGCSFDYQAYLSWTNGEPTAQTRIYRNGALVHTAAAGVSNWTDTSSLSEDSYSYSIRHWDDPDVSPQVSDSINTSGTCEDNLSAPSVSASYVSTSRIDVTPSGGGPDAVSYDIHLGDGTYLGNTSGTFQHTGLDAGTQYTYKAKARSATDCLSGYGSTDSEYTQLATPTGGGYALGPTSNRLTVPTIPTGATGVEVNRGARGGPLVGTITSPGGTVDDTGLSPDTAYTYYYTAVGTPPDSASDTNIETTMDGVPTSLSAVHTTSDCADAWATVELTWSNGDNTVSQVKVERKEPGDSSYVLLNTLSAGTESYSDTVADGSGDGTTYYRISFVFTGSSSYDTDSLTVNCVPNPPFGADCSETAGTVTVTWNDNSTSPAETGFKIYRAPDSGGLPGTWTQVGTVGAGVETDDDEPGDGTWHYAVSSYNSWGTSSKNECISNPIVVEGEA